MYIKKVSVKGFKSLADFDLELSPFTCLIGMNGCGKSTVLQFFDFISHVLAGDVRKWFEMRRWEWYEVGDVGVSSVEFSLHFSDGSTWSGEYDLKEQHCVTENVQSGSDAFVLTKDSPVLKVPGHGDIPAHMLAYNGSVTSFVNDESLPDSIREMKRYVRSTRVFDTLAPQFLRENYHSSNSPIGTSGQHLSSYLDSIPSEVRDAINRDLADMYPTFEDLSVRELPGGIKELVLDESFDSTCHRITRSRHINDGFLRMAAIIAELHGQHGPLLFDEIENGINPELVEALLRKLTTSPHQVLVTTHSPMILNYLDDDLARESVVFLYKGPDGATRAKRFFDIPSISQKLEVMGPGEAFVDTNLVALTEELNAAATGA